MAQSGLEICRPYTPAGDVGAQSCTFTVLLPQHQRLLQITQIPALRTRATAGLTFINILLWRLQQQSVSQLLHEHSLTVRCLTLFHFLHPKAPMLASSVCFPSPHFLHNPALVILWSHSLALDVQDITWFSPILHNIDTVAHTDICIMYAASPAATHSTSDKCPCQDKGGAGEWCAICGLHWC